jgi:RNA-binding protein with serine-rich domain 1
MSPDRRPRRSRSPPPARRRSPKREELPPRREEKRGDEQQQPPAVKRVCVRNLSRNVAKEHLLEIFGIFGALKGCELPANRVFTSFVL